MDVPREHLYRWRHSIPTSRRSQKIWQYWQNIQKGKFTQLFPCYTPLCLLFMFPTELKCKFGRLKCVCGFGKQIMADSVKDPGIKRCCLVPNRLVDLQALSDGLERCQKSLNDYLDSKRNAFPRFFFISDDELLSILGSSEPTCVQEHIIKVISVLFSTEYSS